MTAPVLLRLAAATLLSAAALPAQALIVIDVDGRAGSGLTVWSFSGASTVEARSNFFDDFDAEIDGGWIVGPDFYLDQDVSIPFITSTVTATIGADSFQVVAIGANNQDPAKDFGIALDDLGSPLNGIEFEVGDLVSFSGSGVAPVDITQFRPGTTDAEFFKRRTTAPDPLTRLEARFNVDVPLPGALPLLATGAALLAAGARRRRGAA